MDVNVRNRSSLGFWFSYFINFKFKPILQGLFKTVFYTMRGNICPPTSIAKTRCAVTIIFCMKVGHHQNFWEFVSGSVDVIIFVNDVIIFKFFAILRFFTNFWNFRKCFFLKLFFKHSHYKHNAITWLCDSIGEKDISDLALVPAYLLITKVIANTRL